MIKARANPASLNTKHIGLFPFCFSLNPRLLRRCGKLFNFFFSFGNMSYYLLGSIFVDIKSSFTILRYKRHCVSCRHGDIIIWGRASSILEACLLYTYVGFQLVFRPFFYDQRYWKKHVLERFCRLSVLRCYWPCDRIP